MRFSSSQLDEIVDGAAGYKFAPDRRDFWRDKIRSGGRAGATAIHDVVMAMEAPVATRAVWDSEARLVTAAAADLSDDDLLYAELYPTSGQFAAAVERRVAEQARTAARQARISRQHDNTMMAAAGDSHGPVPGHEPGPVQHAHEHVHKVRHAHPHTHPPTGHIPGTPHGHGPLAGGVSASADDDDYRTLFGPG